MSSLVAHTVTSVTVKEINSCRYFYIYVPFPYRMHFVSFLAIRARILPMSQIVCTMSSGVETVELYIDEVDSGEDTSMFTAVLTDEDGPIQTEYFETDSDIESFDLIVMAMQTIQNSKN